MDVDQGEVLIDGVAVTDYGLHPLRRMMGIVSQQSILFNDSFKNNIAFGIQDIPKDEDITSAARVANAHEFIIRTLKYKKKTSKIN